MAVEPKDLPGHLWTYEEIIVIEDDVRRELYDGEIVEMSSPGLIHQSVIGNLLFPLVLWAQKFGGKVYLSPLDLYVSPKDVFIPDLTFYSAEQMAGGTVESDPNRLTVTPSLAIEVISELTIHNDRVRKIQAYAEFGIASYWIVDPTRGTLEEFRLRDNRYQLAAKYGEGEIFTSVEFPELQISLKEIFSP